MPNQSENGELVTDCDTLLAARDELAGDASLNWSADIPIREWEGVSVDDSTGRVTGLKLASRGLTGQIPVAIGNLTGLKTLELEGNRLAGDIPPELGNLTNLRTLKITNKTLRRDPE